MHEMMSSHLTQQRREELLREVERDRLAKALRTVRKWRAARRSALVWEMKRYAGRLRKLLRAMRNVG